MVNYLLWDRWEPPSPPPIPPGTPKPEESGNSSSSSSTVSEDLWLLAPLSAAGKSTVKLANKNVWNRWLSAGEDMPGEINISARTTRKKGSCEEGKKKKKKAERGELLRQFYAAIPWFSGAESELHRQSGSKVVSLLHWAARPSLRSSRWQHESKEHELLSEDTQPTCAEVI